VQQDFILPHSRGGGPGHTTVRKSAMWLGSNWSSGGSANAQRLVILRTVRETERNHRKYTAGDQLYSIQRYFLVMTPTMMKAIR
jgi:hypothetical protein